MLKKTTKILIGLFVLFGSSLLVNAQTVNIYVSPNGASTGNGVSITSPVSLSRARVVARENPSNPCIIWLMDGNYGASRIVLDATDSRSASVPVTYKAINPSKPVFNPYTALNRNDFMPIPSNIISRIIDPIAKTKVMQLNLTPYNLSNMNVWPNVFDAGVVRWPTFFKDTTILPLSQYPNGDSLMRMKRVLVNGNRTDPGRPGGVFVYRDDRGKFWSQAVADGLWLKGNWRVPWQVVYVKTLSINTRDSIIAQVEGINLGIGDKYTRPLGNGREPYVAVNLLEEIDQEGEWAINFATKMLYMWPPTSGQLFYASDYSASAISLTQVNHTHIEGLTIKGGVADAVRLTNCNNVTVAGMNISHNSSNAIMVVGGRNCTIRSNNLYELGQGGVILTPASTAAYNADQLTLTPCNHRVVNNHIYNFAKEVPVYSAAINLRTVIGAYAAHNKIHGTPHVGVLYDGNLNVMEYNELFDIVRTYDDMGAFYRATLSKSRGNKIRYNYVHDSPLSKGTFYDNGSQGDSSSYNVDANNLYGMANNGGYFNTYTNSIVVNGKPATNINVTRTTDASFRPYLDSLRSIYNASSIYRAAFPETADMVGSSTINTAYSSRIWPRLTGNVFISNTQVIRNIPDASLFNTDGTTNTTYAQTQMPFTSYRTVVANNIRLSGVLTRPIIPFSIDSLKQTNAFSRTLGKDWRINRIGLYVDDYRPALSASQIIPGIAPQVSLVVTSNHNFDANNPLILRLTVKNPNIANCISQVKFFNHQNEIQGLAISRTVTSFDSVVYVASWVNAGVGSHQITAIVYDAPNWQYTSNQVNILATLPLNLVDFTGKSANCETTFNWTTLNEVDVDRFEIEYSSNGENFASLNTLTAKCNNATRKCYYTSTVPQTKAVYYRLKMIDYNGEFSYSNVIYVSSSCNLSYNKIKLYPNPTDNGFTTLSIHHPGNTSTASIILINTQGQKQVLKEIILKNGHNNFSFNTTTIPSGVYIITVINQQHTTLGTAKLMVK